MKNVGQTEGTVHKYTQYLGFISPKQYTLVMRLFVAVWSLLPFSLIQEARTLNIVAISTLATRSHFLWMDTLVSELLARGHQITELTVKQPAPHPNRTSVVLEAGLFTMERYSVLINVTYTKHFLIHLFTLYDTTIVPMYKQSLESNAFRKLKQNLSSRKEKTDLIIIDYVNRDPLIGVSQLVGYPPIIAVTAFNRPTPFNTLMGIPQLPSLAAHELSSFGCEMSFTERVQNFLAYALQRLIEYFLYEPAMNQLLKESISSDSPSLEELEQNISIAMTNTHPTTHCQQASFASLVDVGFLHIKPPKSLPKDIQNFLDEANDGAIVVSFGSTIEPDVVPELQDTVLSVIRKSKQRFLWKTLNAPKNLPPNVLVSKWLPQSDILAHPKVQLLIAHGGTLSMQEAVYRGVPILIIPFFLDQLSNADRVADWGIGRKLAYDQLTAEALSQEITSILENVKYKEKIQLLSKIAQDQPESALQRAVFWLEFVGRHKGAPHLRNDTRRMSWIKYYSIDVIALLTFGVVLVVAMIGLCIRCVIRHMCFSKRKMKVQ